MSDKHLLRLTRESTIINATSKEQEKGLVRALMRVFSDIKNQYGVKLSHSKTWYLSDIVSDLKGIYPDVKFFYKFDTSYMKPDGGIIFLKDKKNKSFPILISEAKNQGTNDLRAQEGKSKQAQGNAVERLGKNVIGFRTAIMHESIFPFVCFGYGCDFDDESSILDRVITISMFGELNKTRLYNEGSHQQFNRGSFYFRNDVWSEEEMYSIMFDIASRSILYYFSKYKEEVFK